MQISHSDVIPALTYAGFQRIFFLNDIDGSRRSRVNEARSAERKK